MRTGWLILAAMAAMTLPAWAGADLDVPLTVVEPAGVARESEPVSAGVPLPVGLVKDPATLKLVDDSGNELPAQFSAINRWGHDQSVMWVLVQSQVTIPAKGSKTFHLKNSPSPLAGEGRGGGAAAETPGPGTARLTNPVKVTDAADAITVETGAIKFTVSKKRFNLIEKAWVTAGGKDELVLGRRSGVGIVLGLPDEKVGYASTAVPPTEVVIEEAGPLRATIMVRGLNMRVSGKGKLPYLYGYLVRLRAYAGQPFVRISYALTNGHEPAIGSPVCDMHEVDFSLAFKADRIAEGQGWIAGENANAAANLGVRYLKENSPAKLEQMGETMEGKPEETLTGLELRPIGGKEDYLDICSRKTYEMQLTLEPKDKATKGDELLARFNGALRFWCPSQWVSETKAWSDFGYVSNPPDDVKARSEKGFRPYKLAGWRDLGSDPEFESGSSKAPGGGYEPLLKTAPFYLGYLQTNNRAMFDQLERTSWHWRDRRYIHLDGDWADKPWQGRTGVYWAYYNKGGKDYPAVQPKNYGKYDDAWNYGGVYGPMDTQHFSVDEVVNYYYLTGDRQCLDALNAYGKEAASFCAEFVKNPNAKVGREHGWVTRALINVYEATGDKRWFEAATAAVKSIMDHQDKTAGTISPILVVEKSAYTGKMGPATHVPFMNAAVGMALGRYYRHHPEEDVRDSILGIADWLAYDVASDPPKDVLAKDPKAKAGFSYYWASDEWKGYSPSGHRCMSTMGWAFLATGQQRYLDAADKHAGKVADWCSNGFGQEYVVIKTTKRPDAVPPAAVKDLKAEAIGGGKVKLTWTAPGNDADKGTAAEYQVKYAAKEIKERSDWRTKGETEISFWAATNCKGEPKPAAAGSAESFTAEGFAPGTYWFAIKTYDAQPNQSDLSNVVKVEVK